MFDEDFVIVTSFTRILCPKPSSPSLKVLKTKSEGHSFILVHYKDAVEPKVANFAMAFFLMSRYTHFTYPNSKMMVRKHTTLIASAQK